MAPTPTFSEITSELDKALSAVDDARAELDDLNSKAAAAAAKHSDAINRAKELRTILNAKLNDSLGQEFPQNK